MNKLVNRTLRKTGLSVGRMKKPVEADEYIVYYPYDEFGGLYADNKEVQTRQFYQVDLFMKSDYDEIAKELYEHMLQAGFSRITKFDEYEETTGYYRVVFRFSYSKEND